MFIHRPLVTVGMAVFNGEKYLEAAIRSVLTQDFKDWELLIVDDGSSDSSMDIVKRLKDPRLRTVRNDSNEGLVAVRNRILQQARGSFVAWLDQDDLAASDRLSTQVDFLQRNEHVSLCGSVTRVLVHSDGLPDRTAIPGLPLKHRAIRAQLPFINPIACNTVMLRVADFEQQGLYFRTEFGNSLDYDLWSRASDRLLFRNLPTTLGTYRIHREQTSQGTALSSMNEYALRVQIEIIGRALGLSITDAQVETHRAATIAPLKIADLQQLTDIAEWFSVLQIANKDQRGFDARAFNHAVIQQWLTVIRAASYHVSHPKLARYLMRNAGAAPVNSISMLRGVVKGLRRAERRRLKAL